MTNNDKLEQDVRNLSEAMDKIAKLIIAKRGQANGETNNDKIINEINDSSMDKKKKKKKKNKIHCSFCNEVGHTRAKCPKKLGIDL